MNNYKKDKGYIKQRLEYVSPVDYISELEEKIEYLEYLKNENERLNNVIDELENWCLSWKENDKYCYLSSNNKDKCRYDIWGEVLDKLKELKGETNE